MGKKPKKCIKVKEARELQDAWCNTRTPEIDRCLGFQDHREFSWSVDELMEYLKYVKKKSKKMGIDDPGVRLYFGAYPKEKCKMNKGYATVFFAPTGDPAEEPGKDGGSSPNNYKIDAFNLGSAGDPPHNY